jgi:hypothetical protein
MTPAAPDYLPPHSDTLELSRMRRLPPLLVSIAMLACTQAPARQEAPPIIGAWRSSLQFSSGAFASIKDLEFMYVFNQGGTLTESSNYDGAPPVPPAYGVWRAVSANEFEARYEFYITAPSPPDAFKTGAGWLPSGRGIFTERITLSADGKTFGSVITYQALDTHGQPVEGGGTATGAGVRIGL